MTDNAKAKLLSAIDDYNEAQPNEAKHIDAYDVIHNLMECGDDEILNAVAEINKKTEDLEQ